MKQLTVLMAVMAVATTGQAADKPADMSKPVKVFIMMGQSNMLGFGRLGPASQKGALEYYVKSEGKYPYLVDENGQWTKRNDVRYVFMMAGGKGTPLKNNDWLTPKNNFGPELGFGYVVGEALPDPALLLKVCIGNRGLCGELKPIGMEAMLEQFDMTIDKKFLYGPTVECVRLIESLQPTVDNLSIELDMAHVPLMGETFAHAIRTVAPYLSRVHLGNCVLRDKHHPRYGDTHPPIGYEAGEIDVPQVAEIFRLLREVGFLSKAHRGDVLLETTPWPGKSVEETLVDNWGRIEKAWQLSFQLRYDPATQYHLHSRRRHGVWRFQSVQWWAFAHADA
jgi:hypothetical protein